MVGDNRHDLEMARAGGAGLAVGVLSGTGTRETLAPMADVILDSIADLPGYLAASDQLSGSLRADCCVVRHSRMPAGPARSGT